MPNRLPVPLELLHLLEKREADRRAATPAASPNPDRRTGRDRRRKRPPSVGK